MVWLVMLMLLLIILIIHKFLLQLKLIQNRQAELTPLEQKVQNGLLGSLGDIEESINGSVRIRFVVMEDGSLGNFEVLEESPKAIN